MTNILTTPTFSGDLTGTLPSPTLTPSINVQQVSLDAVLQASGRHGSSAYDNTQLGLQNTTQVATASNGVNVSSFAGSGTLNVVSTAAFPSPSGPNYAPSPCILSINAGLSTVVYISYTGTTATTFTGCQVLNSGSSVLATGQNVFAAPIAVCDVVVCGDSILSGVGSNVTNNQPPNDWFTQILARENRLAGLPDPTVFRRCFSSFMAGQTWSNLAAGSNKTGLGPIASAYGSTTGIAWNPGATNAVIGDTWQFRRAIVHIEKQTNGAGVQVSFNGGSTYTSTYDTNGSGVITVDSGDLGSCITRTVQVKQLAAVTGTGAAGLAVIGYLPYSNDGTSGVAGYNFAQSGAATTNWITCTDWDTYWLPLLQPRRIYMALGVNDLANSLSLSSIQTNLTTLVQRAQKASPLSEIVLAAEWHVGNTTQQYNTGITYANWSTYTNVIDTVAQANNCTFVDMNQWFGDAALWSISGITTTNGGSSATNSVVMTSNCTWNTSNGNVTTTGNFNTSGVYTGMAVAGTGIQGGTTITVTSATTGTLSLTPTILGSGGTLTFTGYPNVTTGMYVYGQGIPAFQSNGTTGAVTVASISGATVNFAGNYAAIVGNSNIALTFTNDNLGITNLDGVHFASGNNSNSGKDAQVAIADMFWNNLSYYKSLAPITPLPGWTPTPAAWTYVASGFGVANGTLFNIIGTSNYTSIFSKGTKLTWTESGVVKYGVVQSSSYSSSTTSITMIPTSDYQMAATPDSGSMFYSYSQPPNFPSYFTWYLDTSVTNCTWTTTTAAFTTSSSFVTAGIVTGMSVMGAGIPAGETVTVVDATHATLTTGTGVTGGTGTLKFSWQAGFSSTPLVGIQNSWSVTGGVCTVSMQGNYIAGTSNATTYTMKLPISSSSAGVYQGVGNGTDNSAAITMAIAVVTGASNTLNLYKNTWTSSGGAWTSSGSKGANFSISYSI